MSLQKIEQEASAFFDKLIADSEHDAHVVLAAVEHALGIKRAATPTPAGNAGAGALAAAGQSVGTSASGTAAAGVGTADQAAAGNDTTKGA